MIAIRTVWRWWVPAIVFGLAAGVKVIDPSSLADVMAWMGVPAGLSSTAHWTVVAVELTMSVCLAAFGRLVRVRLVGAGLLLAFSGVLVALAVDPEAPACGCLGKLGASVPNSVNLAFGLGRNFLLIFLLLWPTDIHEARQVTAAAHPPPALPDANRRV